ncbi:helix-turn-helix transcriptional regulator [Streptomyces sp. NPDC091272]|uniref:helix-turn-helix transcriptional regulator n=1 Tax=Streptomyces sp. NPDC091272 TaxID=3365981 RepID=UPI003823134D
MNTSHGADDPGLHRALAVPSRRKLLALLREAAGPLGVSELAEASGLSVATVRHHLAELADAGLAVSSPSPGPGRGRPRHHWAPGPGAAHDEAHRDLARALACGWTGDGRSARAAGRAWGERLPQVAGDGPTERTLAASARMGFGPVRASGPPGGTRVLLTACPYRDLARARPDVICALHQGLLDHTLRSTGTRALLRPFIAPDLCAAELTTA